MFKFLKKENKDKKKIDIISKTASLLIHAARIDENYSDKEKKIIQKTIIELGANNNEISEIMENAEKNERNSNQLLDFTKEIKNTDENYKIKIIESLWKIIYSDKQSDMYETNLMRRLAGLMYIDNKTMGDIKDRIKKEKL